MSAEIITAREEHLDYLAKHMRQCDIDEVWAVGHVTPRDALAACVIGSTHVGTVVRNGEPVCLIGVQDLGHRNGAPWMLGTERIDHARKELLLVSKNWLVVVMRDYDRLINFVDDRQQAAHRWLEWLGFKLEEAQPYGLDQLPFRGFTLENRQCAG